MMEVRTTCAFVGAVEAGQGATYVQEPYIPDEQSFASC